MNSSPIGKRSYGKLRKGAILCSEYHRNYFHGNLPNIAYVAVFKRRTNNRWLVVYFSVAGRLERKIDYVGSESGLKNFLFSFSTAVENLFERNRLFKNGHTEQYHRLNVVYLPAVRELFAGERF